MVIEKGTRAYTMKFNKMTGKIDYLTREGWKDWKERFRDESTEN